MNLSLLLLAPLALALPAAVHWARAAEPELPAAVMPADILERGRQEPVQQQVRIEQHVVIRISPGLAESRRRTAAEAPLPPVPLRYKEKHLKGCVPIDGIAAIKPAPDNRLMLFMRDRRVLSAELDRSCHAEEFYSGAYVERHDDGQLCPRRERLQSRTGANCEVAKLNRLEPRK